MDGVELAVCEPVRDVEDPVLIATPEMYVLPPDVIDTSRGSAKCPINQD